MRGHSQRGVEVKQPRESLNSSSIQKYLKGPNLGSPKNPAQESKQQSGKDKKKETGKNQGAHGETSVEERKDTCPAEDITMEPLSTKTEFLEMFAKLENVIKTEILNVRSHLGHLLKRVEIVEEASESQNREIVELKLQVRNLQLAQRDILYKTEEHENQCRRQNLRLRALPEQHGEDLSSKMKTIFNPILDRGLNEELKIDRVHRLRKPPSVSDDIPRDVIIRFHHFEEKARI